MTLFEKQVFEEKKTKWLPAPTVRCWYVDLLYRTYCEWFTGRPSGGVYAWPNLKETSKQSRSLTCTDRIGPKPNHLAANQLPGTV